MLGQAGVITGQGLGPNCFSSLSAGAPAAPWPASGASGTCSVHRVSVFPQPGESVFSPGHHTTRPLATSRLCVWCLLPCLPCRFMLAFSPLLSCLREGSEVNVVLGLPVSSNASEGHASGLQNRKMTTTLCCKAVPPTIVAC